MKTFVSLFGVAILFGVGILRAQQGELPSEVLAISVGSLTKGPFGYNSADLPWRSNELSNGPAEWTSGTSVLLVAKLPPGSRPLPQGHQLLSFVDDSGKNLAKLPEGAATDSHGFPGRDKPLVVSVNEPGTEALIAVRSLKCPDKGALKISGEVEIVFTDAKAEVAESPPVPARTGTSLKAGPVGIDISKFGRRDAKNFPAGMSNPPYQIQNQNELGIQIRPSSPDVIVIKVEIYDGLNKNLIREITGIQVGSENMSYLSSVSPTLSNVVFRVTFATGKSKTSGFVRFSTGLGIYGE